MADKCPPLRLPIHVETSCGPPCGLKHDCGCEIKSNCDTNCTINNPFASQSSFQNRCDNKVKQTPSIQIAYLSNVRTECEPDISISLNPSKLNWCDFLTLFYRSRNAFNINPINQNICAISFNNRYENTTNECLRFNLAQQVRAAWATKCETTVSNIPPKINILLNKETLGVRSLINAVSSVSLTLDQAIETLLSNGDIEPGNSTTSASVNFIVQYKYCFKPLNICVLVNFIFVTHIPCYKNTNLCDEWCPPYSNDKHCRSYNECYSDYTEKKCRPDYTEKKCFPEYTDKNFFPHIDEKYFPHIDEICPPYSNDKHCRNYSDLKDETKDIMNYLTKFLKQHDTESVFDYRSKIMENKLEINDMDSISSGHISESGPLGNNSVSNSAFLRHIYDSASISSGRVSDSGSLYLGRGHISGPVSLGHEHISNSGPVSIGHISDSGSVSLGHDSDSDSVSSGHHSDVVSSGHVSDVVSSGHVSDTVSVSLEKLKSLQNCDDNSRISIFKDLSKFNDDNTYVSMASSKW